MRNTFILGFIILLSLTQREASAQLFDRMEESFQTKPKVLAKLSTTNSFITNNLAKVRAVQLGVNFDNITKIGIGYNWLATDVIRPLFFEDNEVKDNQGELKMNYFSGFIEYTFLQRNKFSMSIPVQLGFGCGHFNYTDLEGHKHKTINRTIAFYEPAMAAEYKIVKYVGIGAGIGYRLMFMGNKHFEDTFTAPTYSIKLKVYFGDIVKDIIGK